MIARKLCLNFMNMSKNDDQKFVFMIKRSINQFIILKKYDCLKTTIYMMVFNQCRANVEIFK